MFKQFGSGKLYHCVSIMFFLFDLKILESLNFKDFVRKLIRADCRARIWRIALQLTTILVNNDNFGKSFYDQEPSADLTSLSNCKVSLRE